MPRGNPLEKPVQGKVLSNREFTLTVLKMIGEAGEAGITMPQLAARMGDEWVNNPMNGRLLSKWLARHLAAGRLSRPRRGVYVLAADEKGLTPAHAHEEAIREVIREHGGFAYWTDILIGLGVQEERGIERRPMKPFLNIIGDETPDELQAKRQEYERLFLRWESADAAWKAKNPAYKSEYLTYGRVARNSPRIRRDHAVRGLYALTAAEVAAMPLRGRWAGLMIHAGALALDPGLEGDPETYWQVQRDFFTQVGSAYRFARSALEIDLVELAALPDVRQSIEAMIDHAKGWEARRLREYEGEPEKIEAFRHAISEEALADFEAGDHALHFSAPLALYQQLADLYSLDAAQLSRGIVSPAEEDGATGWKSRRRTVTEIDRDREAVARQLQADKAGN